MRYIAGRITEGHRLRLAEWCEEHHLQARAVQSLEPMEDEQSVLVYTYERDDKGRIKTTVDHDGNRVPVVVTEIVTGSRPLPKE